MIIPIFIMMVLAWAVKKDESPVDRCQSLFNLKPLTALSCIALSLIIVYYTIYTVGYYILSLPSFKELLYFYNTGNFYSIPFFMG